MHTFLILCFAIAFILSWTATCRGVANEDMPAVGLGLAFMMAFAVALGSTMS